MGAGAGQQIRKFSRPVDARPHPHAKDGRDSALASVAAATVTLATMEGVAVLFRAGLHGARSLGDGGAERFVTRNDPVPRLMAGFRATVNACRRLTAAHGVHP